MRTMERDDVARGPRGRGHGCCGGSDCCGGHGGGPRWDRDDEAPSQRSILEERQRNLEEELAEVTGKLRDLGADRS